MAWSGMGVGWLPPACARMRSARTHWQRRAGEGSLRWRLCSTRSRVARPLRTRCCAPPLRGPASQIRGRGIDRGEGRGRKWTLTEEGVVHYADRVEEFRILLQLLEETYRGERRQADLVLEVVVLQDLIGLVLPIHGVSTAVTERYGMRTLFLPE